MKDETKEILNKLLEYFKESNINDFGYEKDKLLSYKEAHILLDYITNLQERCEYLERSNNRREDEIISLRDECVDGETYKSRNEKAVELLQAFKNDSKDVENNWAVEICELTMRSLQGSDKE